MPKFIKTPVGVQRVSDIILIIEALFALRENAQAEEKTYHEKTISPFVASLYENTTPKANKIAYQHLKDKSLFFSKLISNAEEALQVLNAVLKKGQLKQITSKDIDAAESAIQGWLSSVDKSTKKEERVAYLEKFFDFDELTKKIPHVFNKMRHSILYTNAENDSENSASLEDINSIASIVDNFYSEMERRFPGRLYFPLCQTIDPLAGEGVCEGMAKEALRGGLGSGRIFGHIIGEKPIFTAVTSNKKISPRQAMAMNMTAAITPQVIEKQFGGADPDLAFGEIFEVGGGSMDHAFNNVLTQLDEGSGSGAGSGYGNFGVLLSLRAVNEKEGSHALSFIKLNNYYIAVDINTGVYVFKNKKEMNIWFLWYIKENYPRLELFEFQKVYRSNFYLNHRAINESERKRTKIFSDYRARLKSKKEKKLFHILDNMASFAKSVVDNRVSIDPPVATDPPGAEFPKDDIDWVLNRRAHSVQAYYTPSESKDDINLENKAVYFSATLQHPEDKGSPVAAMSSPIDERILRNLARTVNAPKMLILSNRTAKGATLFFMNRQDADGVLAQLKKDRILSAESVVTKIVKKLQRKQENHNPQHPLKIRLDQRALEKLEEQYKHKPSKKL